MIKVQEKFFINDLMELKDGMNIRYKNVDYNKGTGQGHTWGKVILEYKKWARKKMEFDKNLIIEEYSPDKVYCVLFASDLSTPVDYVCGVPEEYEIYPNFIDWEMFKKLKPGDRIVTNGSESFGTIVSNNVWWEGYKKERTKKEIKEDWMGHPDGWPEYAHVKFDKPINDSYYFRVFHPNMSFPY